MTRIKMFSNEKSDLLENDVNEFLEELNPLHTEIIDIKYTSCANDRYFEFSAMVIYD